MSTQEKHMLGYILRKRGTLTKGESKTAKMPRLQALVGEINSEEKELYQELLHRMEPYLEQDVGKLKEQCLQRSLAVSGNKYELAESLASSSQVAPITADLYQQAVIMREDYPLVVSAGPGSGKTTTLAFKIAKLASEGAPVVAVMYNIEAGRSMKSKLKKLKVKYTSEPGKGIYVGTFHQLASSMVPFQRETSYDELIRRACICSWDHLSSAVLIIDEAQDLADEKLAFARLLLSTCPKHLLAGDPRQEIYAGAVFFTSLWESTDSSKKMVLPYNYRSGYNIIATLNYYSEKFFPEIHEDQYQGTQHAGSVKVVSVTTEESSFALYNELAEVDTKSILVISPVSIDKYGHRPILESTNALLTRAGKRMLKMLLPEQTLDFEVYNAGTSMKLKGLEADKVVIFGAGFDFATYGLVQNRQFARLLYVALSRAKNELVILFDAVKNPFLGALTEVFAATPFVPSKLPDLRPIRPMTVTEFCKNHDIPVTYDEERSLALRLDIGPANDITGTLAEVLIGIDTGLPLWYQRFLLSPLCVHEDPKAGLYVGQYSLAIVLKKSESLSPPFLDRETADREVHVRQIYLLKKAIEIGLWVDVPAVDAEEASLFVGSFHRRFAITAWGTTITKDLKCDRGSSKTYNTITGMLDFESDDAILEIKYSDRSRDPKHLLQCLLYSEMFQRPVLLINVKLGEVSRVEYLPEERSGPEIYNYERLSDGIRFAKTLSRFRRVAIPDRIDDKVLVTYDTESTLFLTSDKARLLEIGGCAAYASGKVLSLISELGHHVKPDPEHRICHGLKEGEVHDHDYLVWQTEQFVAPYVGNLVNLKWGTDDLALVLKRDVGSIDVNRIHKVWCEANGRARKTACTLSDVFAELFPELVFHAHHAFDDAYATMLVFFGMIE